MVQKMAKKVSPKFTAKVCYEKMTFDNVYGFPEEAKVIYKRYL